MHQPSTRTDGCVNALVDPEDDVEAVLRQFDLELKFGPCTGMTRYERWMRAKSLGLDPPQDILDLLRAVHADVTCGDPSDHGAEHVHSLFEGRI